MKKVGLLTTLLVGGLLLTGCATPENPVEIDSGEQFITYEKVDSGYIYKYETTIFEDEHIYYPLTFSIFSEKLLSNSDINIEVNEDLDGKHGLLELKTPNGDFVDAFGKDYHLISIGLDLTMYCQSSEKNNRKWLFLQGKLPGFDESCGIDMGNYDAEPFNSEPFGFKLSVFPGSFWIRKVKNYDELTDKCKESIADNNIGRPLDTIYGAIEPVNEKFNCMVTWSGKPTNLLSMDLGQKKRDAMLEAGIFHNVEEGTFTVSDGFYSYTFMDKNLGAEIAGTGEDSYGCLFQWGNDYCFPRSGEVEKSSKRLENPEIYGPDNHLNNPVFITPQTREIKTSRDYWINDEHNDDSWGGALNEGKLIHKEPDFRRGPCPEGYHVPTYDELRGMLWAFNYYYRGIGDDPNNHSFEDEVLIPFAGSRDFEYGGSWGQGEHRGLWSSTPSRNGDLAHSQALYSSHSENDLSRGAAFSVRCFKNDKENILVVEDKNMNTDNIINLKIGNAVFDVILEENSATKALVEKLHEGDVVVNAHEYGGFEKVGNLGFDLPRADKQITTEPGDLVLYQGNQISLFYESNSWSYTKLGKIQMVSKDGLKEILRDGDVTLVFSLLK